MPCKAIYLNHENGGMSLSFQKAIQKDAAPLVFDVQLSLRDSERLNDNSYAPFHFQVSITIEDVQTITYDGYCFPQVNKTKKELLAELIFQERNLVDIDFDGTSDILLIRYSEGFKRYNNAYKWNAQTKQFEAVSEIASIPNIIVDSSNKVLRGMQYPEPYAVRYHIYTWQKGELVETHTLDSKGYPIQYSQTPSPAFHRLTVDGSIEVIVYERKKDGSFKVVFRSQDPEKAQKFIDKHPLWKNYTYPPVYE